MTRRQRLALYALRSLHANTIGRVERLRHVVVSCALFAAGGEDQRRFVAYSLKDGSPL